MKKSSILVVTILIAISHLLSSCAVQKKIAPIEYHHKEQAQTKLDRSVVPLVSNDGDVLYTISNDSPAQDVEQDGYIMPKAKNNDAGKRVIYHEVQIGETIEEIADIYGLSIESIALSNGLKEPYKVEEFEILKLELPKIRPSSGKLSGKSTRLSLEALEKATPKLQFIRPVDGPVISTFGQKTIYGVNKGINIAASQGAPVRAAAGGKVIYSDYDATFGNLVIVKLTDKNMVNAYAHLADKLLNRGEIVEQGDLIGNVGDSGKVDTPQLHFAVREGKQAKDPLPYLE